MIRFSLPQLLTEILRYSVQYFNQKIVIVDLPVTIDVEFELEHDGF